MEHLRAPETKPNNKNTKKSLNNAIVRQVRALGTYQYNIVN